MPIKLPNTYDEAMGKQLHLTAYNLLPAKLLKQPKEMAPYMDMCFYLLSTVCILECICCVMILIISW
jgi:hypothetical protein